MLSLTNVTSFTPAKQDRSEFARMESISVRRNQRDVWRGWSGEEQMTGGESDREFEVSV